MLYKIYIIPIFPSVTITLRQIYQKHWNPEKDVLTTVISLFDILKFLFENKIYQNEKGKISISLLPGWQAKYSQGTS